MAKHEKHIKFLGAILALTMIVSSLALFSLSMDGTNIGGAAKKIKDNPNKGGGDDNPSVDCQRFLDACNSKKKNSDRYCDLYDRYCVPDCVPLTCANSGYECGPMNDGCGSTLNCGACAAGEACEYGFCVLTCTPSPEVCDQIDNDCDGFVDEWDVCMNQTADMCRSYPGDDELLEFGEEVPIEFFDKINFKSLVVEEGTTIMVENTYQVQIVGFDSNSVYISSNGEVKGFYVGETKLLNGLMVYLDDVFVNNIGDVNQRAVKIYYRDYNNVRIDLGAKSYCKGSYNYECSCNTAGSWSNCQVVSSCNNCEFGDCMDGLNTTSFCGNGLLEANEECDDANSLSGDGCSANCTIEHNSLDFACVVPWDVYLLPIAKNAWNSSLQYNGWWSDTDAYWFGPESNCGPVGDYYVIYNDFIVNSTYGIVDISFSADDNARVFIWEDQNPNNEIDVTGGEWRGFSDNINNYNVSVGPGKHTLVMVVDDTYGVVTGGIVSVRDLSGNIVLHTASNNADDWCLYMPGTSVLSSRFDDSLCYQEFTR